MTSTPKKISNLVNSQVPEFVRNGSPLFVTFLEAYYEYLEQTDDTQALGKLVDRTASFNDILDIDGSIDLFSDHLFKQYLSDFPKDVLANKKTLVKNIKDFYRSKGSEKSFRFLFHALFGEDIDIYYPKDNILIPSSGKWFIEKSVRITNIGVNGVPTQTLDGLQFFSNTRIQGQTSRAEATVERVIISFESGVQIYEVFVSDQDGSFEDGESIETIDVNGNVLTAKIASGIISQVAITDPGSKYNVGDVVNVESSSGNGAIIFVSSTTVGNVAGAHVVNGGAGFRVGDQIIFTGGGGSGANAFVGSLLGTANSFFHANTYTLVSDIIGTYENVALNVPDYGFLGQPNSNSNTFMNAAFTTWQFGPTGPIDQLVFTANGSGYSSAPVADAVGNTSIKRLGILGRMSIVDGGLNYTAGDKITYVNPVGCFGTGAEGNVVSVNVSGSITHVEFIKVPGFPPGGTGFDPIALPTCNIGTSTGSGGNVAVTALLGYGNPDIEIDVTAGTIGSILSLTIGNPGSKYATSPTLNLKHIGDGTATAIANVVAGTFTYPGRFLDETGFPSGFNFLQDADYYQNFSYVIRVKQSIDQYRKYVKNLVHPGGMKLWGQYELINSPVSNVDITPANGASYSKNYVNVSYSSFEKGYLTRQTPFSNFSNTSQGFLSVWFQGNNYPTTAGSQENFLFLGNTNSSSRFSVSVGSTGDANGANLYVQVLGKDSGGNTILDIRSNTNSVIQPNNWVHMLSSWNTSNAAQTTLYLSNVPSLNVVTFSPNTTFSYNVANIGIGGTVANTNRFSGNVSELLFDTHYIDFTDFNNRLFFISNDLNPVNVAVTGSFPTGLKPVVFMPGSSSSINVNNGLGGDWSNVGTFTGGTMIGLGDQDLYYFRIDEAGNFRIDEAGNFRISDRFDP